MANKFEMGSSEFTIPEQAKEHYTKEELEAKKDMYSANEYDDGIDPVDYLEKQKEKQEISKKAAKKILAFQEHVKQKELNEELKSAKKKNIGFRITHLSEIFSRAA